MKRLKLRSYVVPTLCAIVVFTLFVSSFFMNSSSSNPSPTNYVTDIILGDKLPVMNTTDKVINPYVSNSVTIGKNFYDYKGKQEEQEKSIVKYDDTYMQNSGVDFVSEEAFDVVAILDGEVISVTEDEALGKIIKIQHSNEYTSVYQSLSATEVEKGAKVTQGQVIGKSGTNKMDKDLGNHLHFELYIKGQMVNPTSYLNKSLNVSSKGE